VLGILVATTGIAAATLRLVQKTLFAPFPYPMADRLVLLWSAGKENSKTGLSTNELTRAETLNDVFAGLAPFIDGVTLSEEDEAASDVRAAHVGPGLFELLGIRPMIGRSFPRGLAPTELETVLSYEFWRNRFGGDPSIVGTSWHVSGQLATIVGVMPPGFFFPDKDCSLWLSMSSRQLVPNSDMPAFLVIGRLREGTSVTEAGTRVAVVMSAHRDADSLDGQVGVFPLLQVVIAEYEKALLALLFCGALVQCAASLNVAHLLVGIYLGRRREFAVRMALGATRRDLGSLVLFECAVLCVPITVLGWASAELTAKVPAWLELVGLPSYPRGAADIGLLVCSAALGLAALLGPALAAVVSLDAASPSAFLGEARYSSTGRSGRTYGWGVVAAEVAAAICVFYAAGLMTRTFVSLAKTDWGFDGRNAFAVDVRLPRAKFDDFGRQQEFIGRSLRQLRLTPGMTAAGMAFGVPVLWGNWYPTTLAIDHRIVTTDWIAARWVVSDGYFRALGVPIVTGREFTASDDHSAPRVLVLSEALARRLCPAGCIGRGVELVEPRLEDQDVKLRFRRSDPSLLLDVKAWRRLGDVEWKVVGVVRDVKMFGLDVLAKPALYTTYLQEPGSGLVRPGTLRPKFVLRQLPGQVNTAALARAALKAVDGEVHITLITDIDGLLSRSVGGVGSRKLLLVVSLAFALLSGTIAGLGAFGVGVYDVTRRGHELRVRAALGALPGDLRWLVIRRTLLATLSGGLVGVGMACAAGRLLQSYLYGVAPLDLWLLVLAVVLVSGATQVGAYLPARQAASTDPCAVGGNDVRL
jgi:putative ABC transport system permease protein